MSGSKLDLVVRDLKDSESTQISELTLTTLYIMYLLRIVETVMRYNIKSNQGPCEWWRNVFDSSVNRGFSASSAVFKTDL